MHLLDAAATARALPYDELVPAVAQAARELARGEIRAPERLVLAIDVSSVLLCMPALAADLGVTKLITVHSGNPSRGFPAIQGEVVVFDTKSGHRHALLDGPTLTARRTAAVTLLGIERLSASAPSSALLVGSGVQAAAHAEALADYFGVSRFWISSRNPAHAERFAAALAVKRPAVAARPVRGHAFISACQQADVIITLTTAQHPVLPDEVGTHSLIVGVGAFKPEMAELPADLLHGRQIIVDHLPGAQHEAGDLLQAGVDWTRVRDLAQVLGEGLPDEHRPSVFKTVGQAAWDLAAARVAVAGLGFAPSRPLAGNASAGLTSEE